jgi:hypothetical protein
MVFEELYANVKFAVAAATPQNQRILAKRCLSMVLNNHEIDDEAEWLSEKGYAAIIEARRSFGNCTSVDVSGWIAAINEGYHGDGDMSIGLLLVLETLSAWEKYLGAGDVSAVQDMSGIMLSYAEYRDQTPLDDFLASIEVFKEYKRILSVLVN